MYLGPAAHQDKQKVLAPCSSRLLAAGCGHGTHVRVSDEKHGGGGCHASPGSGWRSQHPSSVSWGAMGPPGSQGDSFVIRLLCPSLAAVKGDCPRCALLPARFWKPPDWFASYRLLSPLSPLSVKFARTGLCCICILIGTSWGMREAPLFCPPSDYRGT